MKRFPLLVILAALIGAAWFLWLTPTGQQESEADPETLVAVRVDTIQRTTLRAYVTAYGAVEPAQAGTGPAASARVAPSIPGVVTAVRCVEGQRVAKGDVLFQLDSRAADVAVEFAEKNLERQRQLLQVQGTSAKLLQEAEQQLDVARVQLDLLRVHSPLAGIVTQVNVRLGEAVDLATAMAEIVDLDRLVISADVPSAELAAIEPGQPAEVVIGTSSAPIAAEIIYISPRVDPPTGTARVRASLPAGSALRPGQFVTLRILVEEHADRLAVPVASVVRNEEGATVIAIVDGNTAVRTLVQTGLTEGSLIEVSGDGLREGMKVVTEGSYGLPEQTEIRVLGE
jgi:membrane fusion protein (multidrug efflux system)